MKHLPAILIIFGCIVAVVLAQMPPLPVSYNGEVIGTIDTSSSTYSVEGSLSNGPPLIVTNTVYKTASRTIVTVWLTDDLTGESYAAVVHTTPRPVSFYKVEIVEE